MIKNKNVLVGVSGSIAAYKVASLVSALVKNNNKVKVIMTQSATQLVGPHTFRALTDEPVVTEMFVEANQPIKHISLTDWADLFIVAPATANIIGKCANGIADDILTTSFISCNKPILFVPAMNVKMLNHPAYLKNVQTLLSYGCKVMKTECGRLACGVTADGRFPAEEQIIKEIDMLFIKKDMLNRHVVITSGGTKEYIDNVRMITNLSSGKMGEALVKENLIRGAKVTFITANQTVLAEQERLEIINVKSAVEMFSAAKTIIADADVFISAAAVADYRVENKVNGKMKKQDKLTLNLVKNPDILAYIGKVKASDQVLVGFALEAENMLDNAKEKLTRKNLDLIVANSPDAIGSNNNKVVLIDKESTEDNFSGTKEDVARKIINRVVAF